MLAREIGVLVVLTDDGPVRASYGARMLGAIARDRSRSPEAGEWVTVRRWCDGPVTVEERPDPALPAARLATVLPLHRNRRARTRRLAQPALDPSEGRCRAPLPPACDASAVGNVTLPTPVFLSGGALCLLAGYLVGSVVGPDTPDRTTGQVVSYDRSESRLCLEGEAIKDQEGVDEDGRLCGTLRRTPNSKLPQRG